LSVELKLFIELTVENLFIRSFKWFSNVLLRLKPIPRDFSTRFLSMYNTRLCLFDNCACTRGHAKGCSML